VLQHNGVAPIKFRTLADSAICLLKQHSPKDKTNDSKAWNKTHKMFN